jgi:Transcription factor Tfb2 (p52) C-terminal domain
VEWYTIMRSTACLPACLHDAAVLPCSPALLHDAAVLPCSPALLHDAAVLPCSPALLHDAAVLPCSPALLHDAQNVQDQLLLWEGESRRVVAEPAVLYSAFEDSELYEAAAGHADNLGVLLWSDAAQRALAVKRVGELLPPSLPIPSHSPAAASPPTGCRAPERSTPNPYTSSLCLI